MEKNRSITGFGLEYEHPVGKKVAIQLAGMYPLPRMGYEITVAIGADRSLLKLQNISGQFVLACNSWPTSHWADVFGIAVKQKEKEGETACPQ